MPLTKEQAINFIRKLSAKTVERGASLEEASAAAAKIQKLCQEYMVTVSEALKEEPTQNFDTTMVINHNDRSWVHLVSVLCKHNFCRQVIFGGQRRSGIFGDEVNRLVVEYLYHSLFKQLNAMLVKDMKEQKFYYKGQKASYRTSWLVAAIDAIDDTLTQQSEIFEKSQTALVVSSKALVNTEFEKAFPGLKKSKKSSYRRNPDAEEKGWEAGKAVKMNKAVGTGSAPKQIGG